MINYGNLHTSTIHYENNGYIRVETPWTVTQAIDNITKPEGKISFQLKHNDKCLVASGETPCSIDIKMIVHQKPQDTYHYA